MERVSWPWPNMGATILLSSLALVIDLVFLDMQTAMMRSEMYRAGCCNLAFAGCTVSVKHKTSVGVLSERGLILALQDSPQNLGYSPWGGFSVDGNSCVCCQVPVHTNPKKCYI